MADRKWTGAYDDAPGCSDCGETEAFALVAMVASCAGWTLGTVIGGAIRFVVRR